MEPFRYFSIFSYQCSFIRYHLRDSNSADCLTSLISFSMHSHFFLRAYPYVMSSVFATSSIGLPLQLKHKISLQLSPISPSFSINSSFLFSSTVNSSACLKLSSPNLLKPSSSVIVTFRDFFLLNSFIHLFLQ